MAATDTFKKINFTCSSFAEELNAATEETIGAVRSAIKSAINKVSVSAKALASSEIRNVYNVPKAVLDQRLEVLRARVENLEAEIVFGGKSISLSYFGARQITSSRSITRKKGEFVSKGLFVGPTRRGKDLSAGVSVEVIKGRRTLLKSTFMAQMKSGHIGVMERIPGKMMKKKKKQAIREKAVVSIASMISKAEVYDHVVQKIDEDLEQKFLHELDYYLGRI